MDVGLINLKRGVGLEVDGSSSGRSLRVAEVDVTAYGTAGGRLVGNGIGGFASRRLLGNAGEGAQQNDDEPLMLKSHGRRPWCEYNASWTLDHFGIPGSPKEVEI